MLMRAFAAAAPSIEVVVAEVPNTHELIQPEERRRQGRIYHSGIETQRPFERRNPRLQHHQQ